MGLRGQPKPPKPLLDSESEAAKHIERLKQANREWQAKYRAEKHYFEEEKKRISRLPFFTRSLAFAALEATSESSSSASLSAHPSSTQLGNVMFHCGLSFANS